MNTTAVIIVNYNGLNWLERCINSIDLECKIIVIDNNSSDGSLELIKESDKEIELICLGENVGFGAANNIGIQKAIDDGYKYVFLLNNDAWSYSNCIKKLISVAENFPQYGILSPIHLNGSGELLDYNFTQYISRSNDNGRALLTDLIKGTKPKDIYDVFFVNAAAWLITRECIETVGLFDSDLFTHYGEDDNFVHRLHYHGFKLGVVPNAFIYHDREDRIGKKKETDFDRGRELQYFVLKGSNPNLEDQSEWMKGQIKSVKRRMIKSTLRGDYTAYQNLWKLKNDFIRLIPMIQKNRELYKKPFFKPLN